MPVNHYFQSGNGIGNDAEKKLHEDLIIEGLKNIRPRLFLFTKNISQQRFSFRRRYYF
jgi:hypothetical protein